MSTTLDWQWENAVAGSFAGLATVTFSHPLDVVRTRFQGKVPKYELFLNLHSFIFTIKFHIFFLLSFYC
ncbi:putative mitochondrial carrier domain superfamily [Helianthus anomalus]